MRGVDGGEDSGGVWMQWRQRRGVDSGTLECEKLDVNAFGECGKAKKFGKKKGADKRKFLTTDACGQDMSITIKKQVKKMCPTQGLNLRPAGPEASVFPLRYVRS
jgi:hypothetical protein